MIFYMGIHSSRDLHLPKKHCVTAIACGDFAMLHVDVFFAEYIAFGMCAR